MRSCRRLGLPCQNSIVTGFTQYPPQCTGRFISFPSNCFRKFSSFSSSHFLSAITRLCGEAIAPILLPSGRLLKYSSLDCTLVFSTRPVILTCLSNSFQKKTKHALGF